MNQSKQTVGKYLKLHLYKRKEFSDLSLLAELVFALSGSNSSVEKGYKFFDNESFRQTSQNVARRSRNALNYKAE